MNPFSWFSVGFMACIFLMTVLIVFDSFRSRWIIDRRFALYRTLLFRLLSSWLYGDKEDDIKRFIETLDLNYQHLLEFSSQRKGFFLSPKALVDAFFDKNRSECAEEYRVCKSCGRLLDPVEVFECCF